MTIDAIVMMIICIILIWGGFVAMVLYSNTEKK